MSRSNFKASEAKTAPDGGKKFPHGDGQRIKEPATTTNDPMAKVPDYPIASVDKSGKNPSFVPPLAYPPPPAPRRPFKVS